MTIPQGYTNSFPPNSVCKFNKSLYGFKQANRQWFAKLTNFLLQLGFKQSYVDTSLFTHSTSHSFTTILVYVDDLLLTGNDQFFINTVKTRLHDTFSIKDLGPLHYYLGIEILRNSSGIVMTQRKYALELLKHAHLLDAKPASTPLDPNLKLNPNDGDLLPDPSIYRTLVGKLIYLTISRPNIAFVAQALSQFSHQPRTTHLVALYRVLRYIKLCPGQGLHFPSAIDPQLTTYYDIDWASCTHTRRSVTGYAIFLGTSLIS